MNINILRYSLFSIAGGQIELLIICIMNINILRYSLFSIAGGLEVDRNFC